MARRIKDSEIILDSSLLKAMEDRFDGDPNLATLPHSPQYGTPTYSVSTVYRSHYITNASTHILVLDTFRDTGSILKTRKNITKGLIGKYYAWGGGSEPTPAYTKDALEKFITSYYIIWIKEYFKQFKVRPDIDDPDNPYYFDLIHTDTKCYELILNYFNTEIEWQKSSVGYIEQLLKGQ